MRRADLTSSRRVVEGLAFHRLDVALSHQPLDGLLNELIERVGVAEQSLEILVRKQPAANQSVEDGILQRLETVFVKIAR